MPQAETAARRADAAPLPFVEANVNHLVPSGIKQAIRIAAPGEGNSTRVAEYREHRVRIHDARPIADSLSLDEQGLALVHRGTAVTDFYDDDEVKSVYYPEMQRLVADVTGAAEVVVFDHTRRRGGADAADGSGIRLPVRTVHNDYTPRSGPQRVRDLLDPAAAEAWLAGRFALINVWRPIRGPVETLPLAVADATRMGPDDFIASDLVYQDRTGEVFDVAYNPDQRWYYVPAMAADEAMLIKCYDSAEDGTARFTAHTAFEDPTSPAGASPRESIEIRTLVRYPAGA